MEDEKGYAYLIGQVESVSVSEGETCKVIVLRPEKVDLKTVPRRNKKEKAVRLIKVLTVYFILYFAIYYGTIYGTWIIDGFIDIYEEKQILSRPPYSNINKDRPFSSPYYYLEPVDTVVAKYDEDTHCPNINNTIFAPKCGNPNESSAIFLRLCHRIDVDSTQDIVDIVRTADLAECIERCNQFNELEKSRSGRYGTTYFKERCKAVMWTDKEEYGCHLESKVPELSSASSSQLDEHSAYAYRI